MDTVLFINFLLIFSLFFLLVSAAPRVTIKNGTLEGFIQQSRKGRDIFSFTGIPYARPPLGELRFKPPEPPAGWEGIKSATANNTPCLQRSDHESEIIGSEDCLYLNVFTPKLPDSGIREKATYFPVLVWFFGGGGISGTSGIYGPKYLLDHDIVLITMDVRLGVLGILSTGDDILPGNAVFKDYVQALRWVRENIQAFGGDPNRVTITGESSGGATVHLLVISPLAKGLFHQAISQSGTAVMHGIYANKENARIMANRLGKELNCSIFTSQQLLDCLQEMDPKKIILQPTHWEQKFSPLTEEFNHSGAFITEEPAVLLDSGKFNRVTWLNGINANEGGSDAIGIYVSPNNENLDMFNNNFFEFVPKILGYSTDCPKESQNEISQKIREYYFNNKTVNESNRMQLVEMFSDKIFFIKTAIAQKAHLRAKSPVYSYKFSYRGSLSYSIISGDSERDWGVNHSDDLLYLFPVSDFLFADYQMTEKDFQMVDIMTTLWANFIQTGNPGSSTTTQLPVKWELVETDALETFVIGGPGNFTMSKNLFKNSLDFWSPLPCHVLF